MLKLKNGKFYGLNYSFALPEGFNYVYDNDPCCGAARLIFVSDDRSLDIIIYLEWENKSAKFDLQEDLEIYGLNQVGDYITVKRGKGIAFALYGKDLDDNSTQRYIERYDFGKENASGETQFCIQITLHARNGNPIKGTIEEAMKQPEVEAFLKSVEYF